MIEAADGEEALQKASGAMVDLVLLDLQMPKIDGFGVAACLQKEPRFTQTPIVALTASAMEGDGERALAAGFSFHIVKPVNVAIPRSEVKRLMGE